VPIAANDWINVSLMNMGSALLYAQI